MPRYVLGLDLGTNSVGWAMVACQGEAFSDGTRVKCGVRVFPAGLDTRKDEVGIAPGRQRRLKRSERRTHRRRRQRRRALLRILAEHGLLPGDRGQLAAVMAKDPIELRAKGAEGPLSLEEFGRALFHLGVRRGFKSNKKIRKEQREYAEDSEEQSEDTQDSDARQKAKDDEEETEKQGNRLLAQLRAEGITLGQYLSRYAPVAGDSDAHKDPERKGEWVRNHQRNEGQYHRRPLRQMYLDEFEALWKEQKKHHDEKRLPDSLKQCLWGAIFFQRRTWWPAASIGTCALTGEKRCPKAHWYGQEFRLWQEVNNLRLVDPETGEEHDLRPEQRIALTHKLRRKQKMTFDEIRRALDLPGDSQFRNFEGEALRKHLLGNGVEAAFENGPLTDWYRCAKKEGRDNTIYDTLVRIEIDDKGRAYGASPEHLRQKANEWGLAGPRVDALVEAAESLPEGYHQYSLSAIQKLLPHMRAGMRVDEAIAAAGFKKPVPLRADRLPPVSVFDEYLTNPYVHRALTEARKVVNLLISEKPGKPAKITIELAREMKQCRKHRRETLKRMKESEEEKNSARAELKKIGQDPKSGDNVLRYRLWKELQACCDCKSPYSAQPGGGPAITLANLFTNEIEIDHIIPRSRGTLEDSFSNKVLCFAGENADKGQNTPYERWSADEDFYGQILHRVEKLPPEKRERFARRNVPKGYASRLLNDTRFTAKQSVSYMRVLGCPVSCVQGSTTYNLRRFWGLNNFGGLGPAGEKNRSDHRHHAIDAVVIALTTPKHVQNLANKFADRSQAFAPPEGWDNNFRDEVETAVRAIRVSFRPERSISGALHKETGYGPAPTPAAGAKGRPKKMQTLVTRVRVEELSPDDLQHKRICDNEIRRLVENRCRDKGISFLDDPKGSTRPYLGLLLRGEKVKPKKLKAILSKPLAMKSGVPVKRVRITTDSSKAVTIAATRNEGGSMLPLKLVEPGGNYRVVVYATPKPQSAERLAKSPKTWTWADIAECAGDGVTLMDASAPMRRRRRQREEAPYVDITPVKSGWIRLFTLCKNDMVHLTNRETGEVRLFRVQQISVDPPSKKPDVVLRLKKPDVVLRLHTAATIKNREEKERFRKWADFIQWQVRKVTVDPIGRVFPCND